MNCWEFVNENLDWSRQFRTFHHLHLLVWQDFFLKWGFFWHFCFSVVVALEISNNKKMLKQILTLFVLFSLCFSRNNVHVSRLYIYSESDSEYIVEEEKNEHAQPEPKENAKMKKSEFCVIANCATEYYLCDKSVMCHLKMAIGFVLCSWSK